MESVKWKVESVKCGGRGATALPMEMDIVFRQAAKAGESLASEFCVAGDKTLHAIRRQSDGTVLATAAFE